MRHGYTNRTDRVDRGVRKSYQGPDAKARAAAEFTALSRLHDVLPLPAVIGQGTGDTLVMGFVAGRQGQDLIDTGHADRVLSAYGHLLRKLHRLNPALLMPGPHEVSDVIRHGDFGPNNVLLDPRDDTVTALLDWEFSGVGKLIDDVAWCE